jgi:hypothetical protein
VRDAQRTKTQPETTATLSVVWAPAGHEARLGETAAWYRSLLETTGARTEDAVLVAEADAASV